MKTARTMIMIITRINRNIVEKYADCGYRSEQCPGELIETLWRNMTTNPSPSIYFMKELIETLWRNMPFCLSRC